MLKTTQSNKLKRNIKDQSYASKLISTRLPVLLVFAPYSDFNKNNGIYRI